MLPCFAPEKDDSFTWSVSSSENYAGNSSLRTSSLSVTLHKHVLCEPWVWLAAFIPKSCTVLTPPLGVLVIECHLFPADRFPLESEEWTGHSEKSHIPHMNILKSSCLRLHLTKQCRGSNVKPISMCIFLNLHGQTCTILQQNASFKELF